jgi:hypothetical protein
MRRSSSLLITAPQQRRRPLCFRINGWFCMAMALSTTILMYCWNLLIIGHHLLSQPLWRAGLEITLTRELNLDRHSRHNRSGDREKDCASLPRSLGKGTTTTSFNSPPPAAIAEQRRYFADPSNLDAMLSLGPHFLTTSSGCRIARWVYSTATRLKRFRDCMGTPPDRVLSTRKTAGGTGMFTMEHQRSTMQPYDTIYVVLNKLPQFVEDVLPTLNVEVVVISGQIHKVPEPSIVRAAVRKLVNDPHVVHWFCQNLNLYFPDAFYEYNHYYKDDDNDADDDEGRSPGQVVDDVSVHSPRRPYHNDHHPKVSPFPFGLKQVVNRNDSSPPKGYASLAYQQVFFESLQAERERGAMLYRRPHNNRTTIYAGPLRPDRHRLAMHVPGTNSTPLPPVEYYRKVAQHDYVLSPNGDRPECFRTYEALGLGTIPVTELDPHYYWHLKDGPIIYNNNNNNNQVAGDDDYWNITRLEQSLRPRSALRNMVLEEYWMEYVEWTVGRQLGWWNHDKNRPLTLQELTMT